jgi:hypothetical protein
MGMSEGDNKPKLGRSCSERFGFSDLLRDAPEPYGASSVVPELKRRWTV